MGQSRRFLNPGRMCVCLLFLLLLRMNGRPFKGYTWLERSFSSLFLGCCNTSSFLQPLGHIRPRYR